MFVNKYLCYGALIFSTTANHVGGYVPGISAANENRPVLSTLWGMRAANVICRVYRNHLLSDSISQQGRMR